MLAALVLVAFGSLGSALTFNARDGASAGVVTKCVKPGQAAITLDDGPYDWHSQIADLLTSYKVKGTFFINGNNWACIYDKDRIANITYSYNLGHQIGLPSRLFLGSVTYPFEAHHTWSHQDLTTVSAERLDSELTLLTTAFERILGVNPAYCRPPYGNYNDTVVNAINAKGMTVMTWNADSMDSDGYTEPQSEAQYKQLLPSSDGSVIALNHETNPTTASTLIEWLIKELLNLGYELVTAAECAGGDAYQSVGQPQTPTAQWYCPSTN
ncbi:carbohydrate esterase family 4 protein [Mycena metata]|uniref:Carbohydrate esterase family 4 protein n=1 Tax=Mycena metata TaxID=1033252 RepID=A0AAD7ISI9_9AGAR|nr:carbohydrate esterase family 4 protein [Mycena metata]